VILVVFLHRGPKLRVTRLRWGSDDAMGVGRPCEPNLDLFYCCVPEHVFLGSGVFLSMLSSYGPRLGWISLVDVERRPRGSGAPLLGPIQSIFRQVGPCTSVLPKSMDFPFLEHF
jgi:hypothetical protein